MAKLIYSAIASLDGYIADEKGEFGWVEPDEESYEMFCPRKLLASARCTVSP